MPKNKQTQVRVLYLVDAWFPFVGGGQIHVKNLRETLQKKFAVFSLVAAPSKTNLAFRLLWSIFSVPFLIFLVKKNHLNLIHSHGFLSGLTGKLLSLASGLPIVHTVHGSHLMDLNEYSLKRKLEQFILTNIRYHQQITVAQNFLSYPNVNSNITLIRNGVDVSKFDQIKVKKFSNPTILFVGRDHPHKDLASLKKAYVILKKKYPSLRLKTISNFSNHNQLIRIYKQSHLFVLPSIVEGQPITILEAWAAKLPVITTSVGDNPFLINHGKNGLLFQPGDYEELARLITKVLNSPELAHKLGKNGYNLIKKNHCWLQIAKKTLTLYNNVFSTKI